MIVLAQLIVAKITISNVIRCIEIIQKRGLTHTNCPDDVSEALFIGTILLFPFCLLQFVEKHCQSVSDGA